MTGAPDSVSSMRAYAVVWREHFALRARRPAAAAATPLLTPLAAFVVLRAMCIPRNTITKVLGIRTAIFLILFQDSFACSPF